LPNGTHRLLGAAGEQQDLGRKTVTPNP
jgi:hypothetical protein